MKNSIRIILLSVIIVTVLFILTIFVANKLPYHQFLFTFFFLYIVFVTGLLLTQFFFKDLSWIFSLNIAFTLGFIIIYILLLIAALFRIDITYIKYVVPSINISLIILIIVKNRDDKTLDSKKFEPWILHYAPHKINTIILGTLLIITAIIVLRSGDPFLYTSDSADQIAYVRTVSRTHETFPSSFYYKDGGILTKDLRKGMYHAALGSINALTGFNKTFDIWKIISLTGSVLIIISLVCAGFLLFGNFTIGLIAAILFILFYHSGLKGYQLITIAYGYPFGKAFYLTAIASAPGYLLHRRKELLFLSVLAVTVAAWTHIAHLIIALFTITSFAGLLLLYSDFTEKRAAIFKRYMSLIVLTLLINAPYLILRYINDYAPNNIIHTHIQGILKFTENFYALNPIVFFESSGILGVISVLSIFIFTKKQKYNIGLRLSLHTLIIVLVLVFNPLWVPFLAEKLSYLLIRFEFAVPAMFLPAVLIYGLFTRGKDFSFAKHRTRRVLGWLSVAVLIVYMAGEVKGFAYSPKKLRQIKSANIEGLKEIFEQINKNIPAGNVIASDPLTSYAIPAFTDNFVVCPFDQHSIPNDSTALERIVRSRVLYDPYAAPGAICRFLRRYGAEYIVINGRVPPSIQTMFWKPTRESATMAIERFKEQGNGFRLLYEERGCAVFEIEDTTCTGLDMANRTPPFIGKPVTSSEIADSHTSGIEDIRILKVNFNRKIVKRGERLKIFIEWVALRKAPIKGYICYSRFDTDFTKNKLYKEWYGKIYRKVLEHLKGERFRFRQDFQPLNGLFPPYSWPPMYSIEDSVVVRVPTDITPGHYNVSLRLDVKTQYPNYSLGDILSDEDKYSGEVVDTITVE